MLVGGGPGVVDLSTATLCTLLLPGGMGGGAKGGRSTSAREPSENSNPMRGPRPIIGCIGIGECMDVGRDTNGLRRVTTLQVNPWG